MELAFLPGQQPIRPGPLARFLPPLEEGAIAHAVAEWSAPGELILDPFGNSPRLAIEAALAGRAVLVTANNPIIRFVLEKSANPFTMQELQTALARLAAVPKNGTRLEPFLLDLYRTECERCGESVIADYFVWERDAQGPVLKSYTCPKCNFSGEIKTSLKDRQRVQTYSRHRLQRALALEQIAQSGDSYRRSAEEALGVYPPRVLFALVTLLNKLEQISFSPQLDSAVRALMLSAFDQTNALWSYPEGSRSRPLQLSISPRFREINVWRSLEQAIDRWAMNDPAIEVESWIPGASILPGRIALFPGPVRALMPALKQAPVRLVLAALPRPNQAFWTLAALWASWLFSREKAAPIRVALQRRRYEWAWYAGALGISLANLAKAVGRNTPGLIFIPEAEPAFIMAGAVGLQAAGFACTGCALRVEERQALSSWLADVGQKPVTPDMRLDNRVADAMRSILLQRGEPASYPLMHAAAWTALASCGQVAGHWKRARTRAIGEIDNAIETSLVNSWKFVRLDRGSEIERGVFWLTNPGEAEIPLSDRVEKAVVGILRQEDGLSELELETRICCQFPGWLTPERRLIRACLESYAHWNVDEELWRFRKEDQAEARGADCAEIEGLLKKAGIRLGYDIDEDDWISWREDRGVPGFVFKVMERASLGSVYQDVGGKQVNIVLPGGRGPLVAEKVRRDPRLKEWLGAGTRILKFRHIRLLAADLTLNRANLTKRLALDPHKDRDPQLPLL